MLAYGIEARELTLPAHSSRSVTIRLHFCCAATCTACYNARHNGVIKSDTYQQSLTP